MPASGEAPSTMSKQPAVVGVGCAALDYLGVVPGMPSFDDAEAVMAQQWLISGGGPVATALVALARLGVATSYLGILGADMVGQAVRAEFVREGVDVSRLRFDAAFRSLTSLVLVEAGTGQRAFISFRDSDPSFEWTEQDRELIRRARFLHLDSWYPAISLPAADIAREAGVPVCLDAYRVDDRTAEWVARADILIATESFPRRYTGENDLERASRKLLAQGPDIVVVTLSERGCLVVTREESFHVAGFPVQVVDTTGAGDVFHGAFLYGLLQSWSLAETASFANAAGALACRQLGGRSAIPSLAELEAFLSRYGSNKDPNAPLDNEQRAHVD
jgi:sulfofructose kinase